MNMIFAGFVITVIGIGFIVAGITEELGKKLDAPKEGISTIDFYDHREDGIYHARILQLGKTGLEKIETKNKTQQQ